MWCKIDYISTVTNFNSVYMKHIAKPAINSKNIYIWATQYDVVDPFTDRQYACTVEKTFVSRFFSKVSFRTWKKSTEKILFPVFKKFLKRLFQTISSRISKIFSRVLVVVNMSWTQQYERFHSKVWVISKLFNWLN